MTKEKKIIFLDHPADLKIKVFGTDLADLFINAAYGMMSYLYPKQAKIKDHEAKEKIRLKAGDIEDLLVDWLSELLYLSDTRDLCFNDFHFDKINENELEAVAFGRRVRAKEDIKAVTDHGLEIKQGELGWEAIILFDI